MEKDRKRNKMKTIMMYCNKNNNNLYLKRQWSALQCMGLVTQGTDRQYNEKTGQYMCKLCVRCPSDKREKKKKCV